MAELSDKQIITSWHTNARPWAKAVQNDEIESRALVTNQAVIQAISDLKPQRVLDVGCGEGWLARTLAGLGMEVLGVDVVPKLIEEAQRLGGGQFQVCSYEAIAKGGLQSGLLDIAICNFSLIGEEAVAYLLRALPRHLKTHGTLVIQTLHPVAACGDQPYVDGWRSGSCAGSGPEFTDPAPWYFRTIESWIQLIRESGFEIVECREPVHPTTGKPKPIIFISRSA